jgi:protein TonB
MATTTKESVPSLSGSQGGAPAQDGMPAAQNTGAQAQPRKDAVGIEIPVVVYASRYSAAGRGLSKAPPPVREETRTVIVFQQGAVVRLSANIAVGEMVVLTNQQTGADVLCRVGAVKTQPGIQNYVDLEFTQRAPGFWDGSSAAGPADRSERPAAEPAARAVATTPAFLEPKQQPSSPASAVSEAVSPAAAVTPLPVIPVAAIPISPLTIEPPRSSPARAVAPLVVPTVMPSASNSVSGVSAGLRPAKSGLSTLTGDRMDWTKQTPASSKKGLWAAIAAVVVAGIVGGGFLLYHREQSALPETGATVAAPSALVQSATSETVGGPRTPVAVEPTSSTAATPVQAPTWLPETTKREQLEAEKAPQAAPQPAQPPQPAPRRIAVPVGKLEAPIAKTPVLVSSSEPPPVLLTQSNAATDGVLRTGELSGVSRVEAPTAFSGAENSPAQPAQPARPAGGQIEMPKLISSPDPLYPAAARAQALEGVVALDALVDATGKVAEVKAISGPMMLRQAAIDALRKWKYQPARVDGQPTAVHTNVNIRFALR